MIVDILIWSFVTVVWVLGLTIVTQPDMGLYMIRRWAEEKEKQAILEPIILCVWCMPSLHSIAAYGFCIALGLIPDVTWRHAVCLPLVVSLSSVVSGSVWMICLILMNKAKSTEHEERLLHFEVKDRKQNHYLKTKTRNNGKSKEVFFEKD